MDGPGLLISGGIALTLASEPGPSLSTGWWPQYAVRYEGNWRHQTIAGFCYQGGFRLRRHLRVAATSVRRPSSTWASYEQGIEAYLQGTSPPPLAAYEEFVPNVVALLPSGSQMQEPGSGGLSQRLQ